MAIEFITTRDLFNKDKEPTGKIRIMKMKEEDEATVKYKCPECGHEETKKEKWEEPFLTGKGANKKMTVVCKGCGKKMTVLKLKKQMAKEKAAEKARRKREEKKAKY